MMVFILLLAFTTVGSSQLAGHGSLDGVYAFTAELRESEDSFMEGSIQFEGDTSVHQLICIRREDTLRCQEIDEFINPVASFLMIKKNDVYRGEWFDEANKSVLPVTFHTSASSEDALYARRYELNTKNQNSQKLLDIPLSPTVCLGKSIDLRNNKINDFSSSQSFGKVVHYSQNGVAELNEELEKVTEQVLMETYFYKEKSFSIEAMIPSFSEAFVDSLQSALVHWKEALEMKSIPVSTQRFPYRFYAICDIDYWMEDYISGSFEYVSPSGDGEGFTFLFDRKDDKFISFEKLIRSGNLPEQSPSQTDLLGTTFNLYGIIYKNKFNVITSRSTKHIVWNDLDIRLKRKMNDNIR